MYAIKHVGHSVLTRTARKLRGGSRVGFWLSDGTKIKNRGRRLMQEVDAEVLIRDAERIAAAMEEGLIEVYEDNVLLSVEDILGLSGAKPAPKKQPKLEEPVGEPDGEMSKDEEEEELTEADLKLMKRSEIDKRAEEYGLDPLEYSNKDLLIEAILSEG